MLTFESAIALYGQWRTEGWKCAGKIAREHGSKWFIETGCYRGTVGNGVSTVILAALAAEMGGCLDSYELDGNNIDIAKAELDRHGLLNSVRFHIGDSVLNLAGRTEEIHFAYLDSMDCENAPGSQEHQLAELEAILPILSQKAIVLLDDHLEKDGGKTKLTVPRLQRLGFRNSLLSFQALFSTEDSSLRPRFNIGVLTGHLPNYSALASRTIYRNKGLYCSRHGYDMIVVRSILPQYANPASHAFGFSWSRLATMLSLVTSGRYEWIWCVGCDTLITNFNAALELIISGSDEPVKPLPKLKGNLPAAAPRRTMRRLPLRTYRPDGRTHLIICSDRGSMVQADSFLVRCSDIGAAYLQDVLNHYEPYKTHPWVEQQAMIDLRDKHAPITTILPQHCMNSFDYGIFAHLGAIYHGGKDCYGFRGQWQPGDFLIHWPATSLEKRLELSAQYEERIVQ